MKPRLKNVTAEDVINCLYYFHVDTPNDVFLLEEDDAPGYSEPVSQPPRPSIPRKPLREDVVVVTQLSSLWNTSPCQEPSSAFIEPSKRWKAGHLILPSLSSDEKPSLPPRPPPEGQFSPVVRRPLGPRPLQYQPETNKIPPSAQENIPLSTRNQILDLPANGGTGLSRFGNFGRGEAFAETNTTKRLNVSPIAEQVTPSENLSITFIRRDPTSGAQWNIGKIDGHPISEDRATKSKADRMCSFVSVHLDNLGYAQFQAFQEDNTPAKVKQAPNGQPGFDREVRMQWSNALGWKFKHHRRGLSDHNNGENNAHRRNSSEISTSTLGNVGEDRERSSFSATRPIECGFMSPWNGRCEFTLGSSGRTLKCKHILTNKKRVVSPVVSSSEASAPASELRFNLPSAAIFDGFGSNGKNPAPSTGSRPQHSRKSGSQNSPISPKPDATSYAALYPSEDEDEDPDDRLDLSLGREKAGGGIRGKRVKLGKLIIHDEGLKMLDLVVAANMGMWWTVWGR